MTLEHFEKAQRNLRKNTKAVEIGSENQKFNREENFINGKKNSGTENEILTRISKIYNREHGQEGVEKSTREKWDRQALRKLIWWSGSGTQSLLIDCYNQHRSEINRRTQNSGPM